MSLPSTLEAQETHMKQFVYTLLESGKTIVISDEKYERIINYLRDPEHTKVRPQFKFWMTKDRQMTIANRTMENGKTKEVLLCCVPDFKKEQKLFDGISSLTVVPEGDMFETIKEIHGDKLHHAGYKKVLEYVQLRYYGLPRAYIQEFCKTCPTCRDKSVQPRRRSKSRTKSKSPQKKLRHLHEEIITAENLQTAVKSSHLHREIITAENFQSAVESITAMDASGNYQTVVIEVQSADEEFDISTAAPPDTVDSIQLESTSVVESEFMARVQVDLMDMSETPDGDFQYICHVMDHFSQFHVLFALKDRSPQEIATGLQVFVLAYFGPPRIIQSDIGRSFIHNALPLLVEQWPGNITLIKGKPSSPQTQSIMEQAGQTIQLEMDTIRQELPEGSPFQWASHLAQIMFKLNTQKPSPVMDTPYGVVFGRQPNTTLLPSLGSRIIGETHLERLIATLTGTQS